MKIVRTRPTRKLAALAVAALAVLAACTPTGPPATPPAQPGDGFHLTNPGLTKLWSDGYKIILFPRGTNPWVQAAHDGLVPLVQNSAVQLQAHTGLAFSYDPSPWGGNFGDTVFPGLIAVNLVNKENWTCGATAVGCGGVSAAGDGVTVGSGKIALRSDYVLEQLWKPNGAGLAELHTTVLHELGHALNLAHYDPKYNNGSGGTEYQTMHNSTPGNSGDYRLGDRNGLKYMAAGSAG